MKNYRASALLFSFFLMSLLVLVGLAVSILVLHDLSAVNTSVAGVQSQYAAEGMTELGLQSAKENLPGYEPTLEGAFVNGALASLNVAARGNDLPCPGQGDEWRALARNESIQIPLFAQTDAAGSVEKVENFYVDFYVEDADGFAFSPTTDVLRWKILGLNGTRTEAISEYIPLEVGKNSAGSPSFFGPGVDGSVDERYKYGKCYQASSFPSVLNSKCSIESFLASHTYNYLVLTNVVQDSDENTIYFGFHSVDVPGVCEFSDLAATGSVENGEARKDLNTLVREGENLPVFDFVIYHTGDGEEAP